MKIVAGMLSFVITVIGVWIILEATANKPMAATEKKELAVWEWRPISQLDIFQTINAAKNEGITTIYLNVTDYTDIREMPEGETRTEKLAQYQTDLARVVGELYRNNIRVQALGGHNNWGNDSHWYLADMVLDLARDFNKTYPATPLSGVQLDIEPYGQTDWEKNKQEYMQMYYLMVGRMDQRMAREMPGLQFGLAVPAWYATNKINGKIILKEIVNRLDGHNDYLAVMAYRNTALGRDGSIAYAQPSFEMIKDKNIQILVGQETSHASPEKITFFGKKKEDLTEAMRKINEEYASNPNFAGIAINNLQTYLQLSQ